MAGKVNSVSDRYYWVVVTTPRGDILMIGPYISKQSALNRMQKTRGYKVQVFMSKFPTPNKAKEEFQEWSTRYS